jgi:hypothetical protein
MSESPSHISTSTSASSGTISLSRNSSDTLLDEFSSSVPKKAARKWTKEEDQRLLAGIEEHGEHNWRAIASVVGTRDPGKNSLSLSLVLI